MGFGEGLLAEFHLEPMEVFPKQESTIDWVGSFIRLPFGAHRKTEKQYPFMDHDELPFVPSIRKQLMISTSR